MLVSFSNFWERSEKIKILKHFNFSKIINTQYSTIEINYSHWIIKKINYMNEWMILKKELSLNTAK